MTVKEACKVLGLSPGAGLPEIKKKYRALMMRLHPDVSAGISRQETSPLCQPCSAQQTPPSEKQPCSGDKAPSSGKQPCSGQTAPPSESHPSPSSEYVYTVQEINAAYSILKETASNDAKKEIHPGTNSRHKREQTAAWDAPINPNAYMERNVLHYAEDHEGTVLGNFCIARGKYMWTTEEDFPLFLLSLYQCGKELLDEADAMLCREEPPAARQRFQAELTYLLAQQFIAQAELLKELAKEETACPDGTSQFYMPAMLEAADSAVSLEPGENLYPSRIRRHRLFLKNRAGQEAGYLSFRDDRLYYVVVPLLEQRRVRIRIQASEKQPEKKKKAAPAYRNLHLWIRLSEKSCAGLPENLNLQIKGLLEKYKAKA